jgi:1,4-dihydroxy-2-naphthoate octaprenyltransferase
LGDVFVLVFFGPVAVGGTYYLQTSTINANVIVAGLAPGLISTAILAVNNFRDIETDRIAGKKTLAVRFGYRFGVVEYITCIVLACLIPIYLSIATRSHYFCNLSLLILLLTVPPIKTICSKPSPQVLNNVLAQTGKLLLIYSILFSAGWLI